MSDKPKQFILRPIPHDQSSWRELSEYLTQNETQVLTVTVEQGEPTKRSLSANALQAVWIQEIANWQGESEHYVRLWVKAKLALPVIVNDTKTKDEEERSKKINWTLNKIGYFDMTEPQQLKVVDMFEITSAMSTRQHNRFREQMQRHYGNMGLELIVR